MAAPARALLLLLLADLGAAQMSVNAMLAALSGNPPPAPPPGQQQRLKTEAPAPATPGVASFGLGCFWGGQISFDCAEGVSTTVVGYMGGQSVAGYAPAYTDYSEHGFTETVQLVYDAESSEAAYSALLEVFWASHNPTSAVVGSAYRSIIFAHTDEQDRLARRAIDTRNIELASSASQPLLSPSPLLALAAALLAKRSSQVASMLIRRVLAVSQRRCAALAAPRLRALPASRASWTVAPSSPPWSRPTACHSGRRRITTRTGTRSSVRLVRAKGSLAGRGLLPSEVRRHREVTGTECRRSDRMRSMLFKCTRSCRNAPSP